MANRSILLNIGVFEANNALRRSTDKVGLNYLSTSDEYRHLKITLAANTTKTFEGLAPRTAVTILRTSSPVRITVVLPPPVVVTDPPLPDLVFTVNKFFVFDQTYQSLAVQIHQT